MFSYIDRYISDLSRWGVCIIIVERDSLARFTRDVKHMFWECRVWIWEQNLKIFNTTFIYVNLFVIIIIIQPFIRVKILIYNIFKAGFPLGGILRAERNFSLSFLISSTREITRQFRLVENRLKFNVFLGITISLTSEWYFIKIFFLKISLETNTPVKNACKNANMLQFL